MMSYQHIFSPMAHGFAVGASLIMAIGAQNAFVLKQGLKKHHVMLTATVCVLCDIFLIGLGVSGLGLIISQSPSLSFWLRISGALFLLAYGGRCFWEALQPQALEQALEDNTQSRKATILAVLAFTLLNPHAYVDTILIIGNIGAQHPVDEHLPFIIGTLLSSVLWFYGLSFGARYLSSYLTDARTWQKINTFMGCLMLFLMILILKPLF